MRTHDFAQSAPQLHGDITAGDRIEVGQVQPIVSGPDWALNGVAACGASYSIDRILKNLTNNRCSNGRDTDVTRANQR